MRNASQALLIALTLAGCASSAERDAKRAEFQRTVPTCKAERECELKWASARNWVLSNAGFKIQNITGDYIETFGSVGGSTYLAARVTKDPLPDGGYRITVMVWCDNPFGCNPDADDAALAFNRQLNAITTSR